MYRKIAAHFLFPGGAQPVKNPVITVKEDGTILDVKHSSENFREEERLEFYDGVIVPGLVNSHFQLDSADFCNRLSINSSIDCFDSNDQITCNTENLNRHFQKAEHAMIRNGTAAIAITINQIAQFEISAKLRKKFWILNNTFNSNTQNLENKDQMENEHLGHFFKIGISPTSSCPNTFASIYPDEKLLSAFHLDKMHILGEFICADSLEYLEFPLFDNSYNISTDLKKWNGCKDITFVICPKADLYHAKRLPDLNLLRDCGFLITIGTDSVVSDAASSILEEMKVIQKFFEEITLVELLDWGSINGAKILGFDSEIGSIEIGKKPGLNLIENINYREMRLTPASRINVLESEYLRNRS